MGIRYLITLLLLLSLSISAPVLSSDEGLITVKSKFSVAETLNRLSRVLEEKGIAIMARISHSDGARKAALSLRPTELLLFGNPKLGTPLMQGNQTVGIDLPMKVLAWKDENGQVWLTYNDPVYFAKRHGVDNRRSVIDKMSKALKQFTALAVGSSKNR